MLLLRPAPSGCDAEAEIRDPRLVQLPAPLRAMPRNPQPPPGTTAPSCTLGRSHSKAPAPWELINYSIHGERGSQPASSPRPCSPPQLQFLVLFCTKSLLGLKFARRGLAPREVLGESLSKICSAIFKLFKCE